MPTPAADNFAGFLMSVEDPATIIAIASPVGAAAAATSIPITALPGTTTIPTGTTLTWTNGQTSTTTSPTAPGAVTIAVTALTGLIAAGNTSSYSTFMLVSFVERYGRRGARTSATRPVFGQTEELETQGRHRNTVSVSGVVSANDPGQVILRARAADGAACNIKALKDGISGYTMVCGVTDDSSDEGADVDLGTFSFTLTAKSAAVSVGVAGGLF
jgi:hypothetical protein